MVMSQVYITRGFIMVCFLRYGASKRYADFWTPVIIITNNLSLFPTKFKHFIVDRFIIRIVQ